MPAKPNSKTKTPLARDLEIALKKKRNPQAAAFLMRFFKTGKGEYAEGDKFLGIKVPETRALVRDFEAMQLNEIEKALQSEWHEVRLGALVLLVTKFGKRRVDAGVDPDRAKEQRAIFDLYLRSAKKINNWDLVDVSAAQIVGGMLYQDPKEREVLTKLSQSKLLWDRRIAMIATHYALRQKEAGLATYVSELLLGDREDLMHKAVGWTLRELGKRVNRKLLLVFLDEHASVMPRTALRYAIEHLSPRERAHYMNVARTALDPRAVERVRGVRHSLK